MESPTSSPTSAPADKTSECNGTGMCGKCLQGGFPLRKEILSFVVVLLIVLATGEFVLYVQAKRELFALQTGSTKELTQAQTTATPYPQSSPRTYATTIALPKPNITGTMPLEKAIFSRRTRRAYTDEKISLADLSQMLWSGQGITEPKTGKRAAPSARESYSMTLFVVAKNVQGLEPGVYEYLPKENALGRVAVTNVDEALKNSGVQEAAQKAPAVILVSSAIGNYQAKTKSTTTSATYLEAGHIGQNLYLQAESLRLGTVVMAGFDAKKAGAAFGLDAGETIEYVVPFGHPAPEVTPSPTAVTPTKE